MASSLDFSAATLREEEHYKAYWQPIPSKRQRFLAIFLVVLLILLTLSLAIVIFIRENKKPSGDRFSFDDIFDPSFKVQRKTVRWIEPDGMSTFTDNGDIYLQQLPSDTPQLFVKGSDILDENGEPLAYFDYWISPDQKHILLATDFQKVWRHSFTAVYYVHTIQSKEVIKISEERTQYAAWAPAGNSIAYVISNDMYVMLGDLQTVIRVTQDGSLNAINGIPAWVYEEEILSSPYAFWWSPDGSKVAFLRSDETDVGTFFMTKYGKAAYPEQVAIKYPKPGFTNPTAELKVFDVSTQSTGTPDFAFGEEYLIVQVAWFDSNRIATRLTNRVQSQSKLYSVDATTMRVSLLSQQISPTGWVDYSDLFLIPESDQYLELVDYNGFNHIALYQYGTLEPVRLVTMGDWEVTQISSYHPQSRRVFYMSTEGDETQRHLYSVNIDQGSSSRIRLTENEGFYSVSFSTQGGFYLLNYNGPDIPYQRLRSTTDPSYDFQLENNEELREKLSTYALPIREYLKVPIQTTNGAPYDANCVLILPPDFDYSEPLMYSVLHRVYGGPASNLVQKTFSLDWHTYLASSENFVVSMCDVRGTAQRGNVFKHAVYKNLGEYEAQDQVEAAKYIRDLKYTRTDNLIVWGWSYGGYLTSKILETGSGVFVGGIAVAPVTDWQYYDTVYTERYMLTPQQNPDGYQKSGIRRFENINGTDYFLVHGTADDNVHFQHTLVLIDELTQANVDFKIHIYTDNDHAINTGANTQRDLYRRFTEFLNGHK